MMSMKTRRPPGQKAPMMMVGPDIKETKRQQKAAERKEKAHKIKKATAEKEKEHQKELDDRGAEAELLLQEQNTEAKAETMAEENVMKRNTLKIPNTALATIRTEALWPGGGLVFMDIMKASSSIGILFSLLQLQSSYSPFMPPLLQAKFSRAVQATWIFRSMALS